jgi:hypothetical protein
MELANACGGMEHIDSGSEGDGRGGLGARSAIRRGSVGARVATKGKNFCSEEE